MTKKQLIEEIASHVDGNPQQMQNAIRRAVVEITKERIQQVYDAWKSGKIQAAFALTLITGILYRCYQHKK